ncbi:MAG: LPP20 family lipoprotein [Treponema sp.]|jgi:hypothetical protein|nr:LPP20 family lipoprotein [Treponema sp.]
MKRTIVLGLAATLTLSMAGCRSTGGARGGAGLGGVPAFVNEALLNAPEDVVVGIGTYKIGGDMSKMALGKTIAETRARADISRQLQTIVKDMITDYTAVAEIDPDAALSFQENITQSLSKAELRGVKTVRMDRDNNGLLWVVMQYDKSAAAQEVNQAASAAKLAVPAAAAFDAIGRMDTAFSKEAGGGPVPVGE